MECFGETPKIVFKRERGELDPGQVRKKNNIVELENGVYTCCRSCLIRLIEPPVIFIPHVGVLDIYHDFAAHLKDYYCIINWKITRNILREILMDVRQIKLCPMPDIHFKRQNQKASRCVVSFFKPDFTHILCHLSTFALTLFTARKLINTLIKYLILQHY